MLASLGCGRIHFDRIAEQSDASPDSGFVDGGADVLRLSPPGGRVEIGERIVLEASGGQPPWVWSSTSGVLETTPGGNSQRSLVVDAESTVRVQDSEGNVATATFVVGEWQDAVTYAGPAGWAFPSHMANLGDDRIVVAGSAHQMSGSETAWLLLDAQPDQVEELDFFFLQPGAPALATNVVPRGATGCLVVGWAEDIAGRHGVVRGSSNCRDFETWDTFQVAESDTSVSSVRRAADETYWAVGTAEAASGSPATFVRQSDASGQNWQTRSELGGLRARTLHISSSRTFYLNGLDESSNPAEGVVLASVDGANWSELHRYATTDGVTFHAEGRPSMVEDRRGFLYVQYLLQGSGANADVVRIDPRDGSSEVVELVRDGPHASSLHSDWGSGLLYSQTRFYPDGEPSYAASRSFQRARSEWRVLDPVRFDVRDAEANCLTNDQRGRLWQTGFAWASGTPQIFVRVLE